MYTSVVFCSICIRFLLSNFKLLIYNKQDDDKLTVLRHRRTTTRSRGASVTPMPRRVVGLLISVSCCICR